MKMFTELRFKSCEGCVSIVSIVSGINTHGDILLPLQSLQGGVQGGKETEIKN